MGFNSNNQLNIRKIDVYKLSCGAPMLTVYPTTAPFCNTKSKQYSIPLQ